MAIRKTLLITLFSVFLLFFSSQLFAVEKCVEVRYGNPDTAIGTVIEFQWVADGDGNFTATVTKQPVEGYAVKAITNPGATAPADNYDITITDEDGVDVMGGALADRDTTTSEEVVPKFSAQNVYGAKRVHGFLTVTITNITNADANGTIKLFIER